MITLNDYLYSGDTVLKILFQYSADLKKDAVKTANSIDLAHSNFLIQIIELLEHTDFLTSQSQRIKEFYLYMTQKYPFLAFTFKGRIKSLIRAEENRTKRDIIWAGECSFFDEAYERLIRLQELDLSGINVNMFKAFNNQLINDGCGLFRGRQILPFEHLSRFQTEDIV